MGKTRAETRAERLEEYLRCAERVQPHELKILGRSQELVEDSEAGAEADPPALAAGV